MAKRRVLELSEEERRLRKLYHSRMITQIGLFGSLHVVMNAFDSQWRIGLAKRGMKPIHWDLICASVMIHEASAAYDCFSSYDLSIISLISQRYAEARSIELFRLGYFGRIERDKASDKFNPHKHRRRKKVRTKWLYWLTDEGRKVVNSYNFACRDAIDNADEHLGGLAINQSYKDLAMDYKRLKGWSKAPLPVIRAKHTQNNPEAENYRKLKRVGSHGSITDEQYANHLEIMDIKRYFAPHIAEKLENIRAKRKVNEAGLALYAAFMKQRTADKARLGADKMPDFQESWQQYKAENKHIYGY